MTRLDLTKYKQSSLGTTVDDTDEKLEIRRSYSFWDQTLLWTIGITRYPQKIEFICIESGEVFETLTKENDFKRMEHYMLYHRR